MPPLQRRARHGGRLDRDADQPNHLRRVSPRTSVGVGMSEDPNWVAAYADGFFERHLTSLAGKPGLRFLQIGAFTGDASVWLLENILTDPSAFLVDVDTWSGSDEPEHEPFDWADVESTYDARMAPYH